MLRRKMRKLKAIKKMENRQNMKKLKLSELEKVEHMNAIKNPFAFDYTDANTARNVAFFGMSGSGKSVFTQEWMKALIMKKYEKQKEKSILEEMTKCLMRGQKR